MTTRKPNRPAPTTLAPDQYLDLHRLARLREYARAEAKRLKSKRAETNWLLIELMAGSGLRAQEVCDLTIADLPCTHRMFCLLVRHGKRDKQRTVDINPRLAVHICRYVRKYRSTSASDGPLFEGCHGRPLMYRVLWAKIKAMGRAIGVDLHPHSIRHSYAIRLYNIEQDLLNVQQQLGHSDVKTTTVYARTASEASKRQARKLT